MSSTGAWWCAGGGTGLCMLQGPPSCCSPCCRWVTCTAPPRLYRPPCTASLYRLQVCKYIDIPLQHISNMTLLAMNRPPQAHTLKLLHTLRERIPSLALRTTFISGFPGGWGQGVGGG